MRKEKEKCYQITNNNNYLHSKVTNFKIRVIMNSIESSVIMVIIYIFLGMVIFFGILGIIYVSYYNVMQASKTRIEQAEGIIDETLRNRYDLIMRADELIKSILKKNYFNEYQGLKEEKLSTFDMDRKLTVAVSLIYQLKEDFEEIRTNKEMKEILHSLKDTDEKLAAAKSYYNKNTTILNGYIRSFPSNVIATLHHFNISPFFDGKDMTDDDKLDFKL